ncbi:MAG: Peptidase and in kexin sedolisin, partial [Rhodospirillales bacterium]|nr:Peptidase and in kexin sedolisin [Rhodospirillales bacterium]
GPQQADGGGSTPAPTSSSGSVPSGSSSGSTPGSTPQGGTQTSDGGGSTPPPESILDDIDEGGEEQKDDPKDVPTVPLIIKATAQAQAAGASQSAIGSQQIKLFPDSVMNVALPMPGAQKPQTDAGADPVTCTTGADNSCKVDINPCDFGACTGSAPPPSAPMEIEIAPSAVTSFNLEVRPGTPLIAGLTPYQTDALVIGGRSFITVTGPLAQGSMLRTMIGTQPNLIDFQENYCRDKQGLNDPYFASKGAWGQKHDDQWALKRIGLTAGKESAWNLLGPKPQPVVVAVIDTGLDWNHLDFDWASLWRNPREKPDNRQDDDGNGYADDVIGWNFLGNDNRPWDHDGHGTLVTGIIAAASNNKAGIAGINPHARIMVLKALNAFGQTRASFIAKAITYAADNGARIVNLSVGGKNLTEIEKAAIAHARGKGVLIVVAAGNEGIEAKEFGPAGADGVLTVAATNLDDSHPAFSNWGPEIDLAAPGVDILSLRARRTDTVLGVPGVDYKAGSAYVGKDRRYYRVSGTSFGAPFVSGVASLVLSKRPDLTVDQLEAVLKNSAEDIQVPGLDQFSGAGMVHAARALSVDPAFSIQAAISGVEVVQLSGKPAVSVLGSAAADAFAGARLELGEGENPKKFKTAIADVPATAGASLGAIPADSFRGSRLWTIRLLVSHRNGQTREARYLLDTGQ